MTFSGRADGWNISRCLREWDKAVARQDFGRGLDVSYRGYRLAQKAGDGSNEKVFLGFVRIAASRLMVDKNTDQSSAVENFESRCSFCLSQTEKLVLGAGVSICKSCARVATDELSK